MFMSKITEKQGHEIRQRNYKKANSINVTNLKNVKCDKILELKSLNTNE